MKKILKWVGIVLGSIVLLAGLTAAFFVVSFNSKLNRQYDFTVEKIAIPADSASIARGQTWSGICTSCHGDNLGGNVMFDDPKLATIYASNLTLGEGGVGRTYSDEDWVRAIRHGVRQDGKALFLMPAHEFHHMNQEDLASLIAFIKTLEPVNRMPKPQEFTVMAKILGELGAFGILFPAEEIDHAAGFDPPIERAATAQYGEYVVNVTGCRTCHGKNLNGGKDPNPNAPPGPNLTPGGIMSKYTEEQFINTLRTGVSLTGRQLDKTFMPWPGIGRLDDLKLQAIFAYLKALPEMETSIE